MKNAPKLVTSERESRRFRKGIWESMNGCDCPLTIVVKGKPRLTPAADRCSKEAIRCNGRLATVQRRLAEYEDRCVGTT